jgi:(S)-2-hydroxyglutarate dehydrogenase
VVIFDYCVVGGGIVGVATALRILEAEPGASLALIEKEQRLGTHQTGHNSGVIHSGIYYPPTSLKARLCREGMRQTKRFCDEHGIAYRTCGKLLVATSEAEVARMEALFERSRENQTDVRRVSAAELRELEPNVQGLGALLVAETGIVDYGEVTETMADLIRAAGAEILLGEPVVALRETDASVEVDLPGRGIAARRLVVCAGLQADRLARMAGLDVDLQIVPFRGEYYRLPAERADLVERLIYPIPDPELPFLGVHLSPTIHGDLTVGPNAVLGFAREGYPRFSLDLRDVATYAAFPGLWRVARSNVRTAVREMRNSLWRRGYLAECRKYCPGLTLADLLPQEAGIRAQAVRRDGTLVHDFVLREAARSVHVLNAPSPAATSALPIGSMIADQVRRVA